MLTFVVLLGWALCVPAARVVILTMDRLSPAAGMNCVPAVLAPDAHPAVALMVARTGNNSAVLVRGDGYLTLNAGQPCAQWLPLGTLLRDGTRFDFTAYDRDKLAHPSTMGAFGDELQARGYRTGALGSLPVLALLMDRDGRVDRFDRARLHTTDADLRRAAAFLRTVDVAAVDLTAMAEGDLGPALMWTHRLLAQAQPALVVACAPNPPTDLRQPWPVSWVVLWPHAGTGNTLYSPSTRRAGLVLNTDLPVTILAALGHRTVIGVGRVCVPAAGPDATRLLAMDAALTRRTVWRDVVFLGYIILLAVVMAGLLLAGWQRWSARVVHSIAFGVAGSWLAMTLTGLWPTTLPALAAEWALGAGVAVLIAHLVPRYRITAIWVAVGVAAFLCSLLAPNWTFYNQISYLPYFGARFYGLGNPAAGLLTAGALALATLPGARWRVPALVLPWLTAGWIFWSHGGANFGMGLATAAMAVVLLWCALPPRRRLGWMLLVVGAGAAVMGALVWIDIAGGAPSHVARLLLDIAHNGPRPLLDTMARKIWMGWKLVRNSDWTYLLLGALAAQGAFLARYRPWWTAHPRPRILLAAGLAAVATALLLNDSGIEPAALLAVCTLTLWLDAAHEEVAQTPPVLVNEGRG